MDLNLPILNQLSTCKNLLIAGMSGGFDIFCGLPIYFELKKHGIDTHLANFSFSDKEKRNEDVTIWCFHKTGAAALTENYKTLAEHLSLDGMLLVDGGVDSLVRFLKISHTSPKMVDFLVRILSHHKWSRIKPTTKP